MAALYFAPESGVINRNWTKDQLLFRIFIVFPVYRIPLRENVSEILEHLLRIASDNPHLEREFEEYHKGVYQDNYYDSVDGVEYCIQHDIVTNDCVLYELKEMG